MEGSREPSPPTCDHRELKPPGSRALDLAAATAACSPTCARERLHRLTASSSRTPGGVACVQQRRQRDPANLEEGLAMADASFDVAQLDTLQACINTPRHAWRNGARRPRGINNPELRPLGRNPERCSAHARVVVCSTSGTTRPTSVSARLPTPRGAGAATSASSTFGIEGWAARRAAGPTQRRQRRRLVRRRAEALAPARPTSTRRAVHAPGRTGGSDPRGPGRRATHLRNVSWQPCTTGRPARQPP